MKLTTRESALPFALITSLFFLWGIAHNLDSILVPHLKKACELNNRESMLVDTSVFMAYFVMALPAGWLMKRWGYKAGIITGLLLFAAGAMLFLPAANTRSFSIFISGLFVIGTGLTLLETAANPFANALGPAEHSTARLNLAQAFNGLAAMLAPVIGGIFILSGKSYSAAELNAMPAAVKDSYLSGEAASVKMPYLVLASVLLLIAFLFRFVRLPKLRDEGSESLDGSGLRRVLRHGKLRAAIVAQFFYVGAQVCITSIFIRTATGSAQLTEAQAASWLGWGYGLAFMTGRFVGTGMMSRIAPKRLLQLFSLAALALSVLAAFSSGMTVVYALVGIGFFMSIMYPTIFSIGIEGLGDETKTGSALIVMSIAGGAILPPLMGYIIDLSGDRVQAGFAIPLICYVVVLLFSMRKPLAATSLGRQSQSSI